MSLKRNRRWSDIVLLLVFVGFCLPLMGLEAEQVDRLLKKWVDVENKSPGVVLGIIDGQGQRIYAHGLMVKDGAAMTGDTLFEIGSITKVFTALLMEEMAQKGELDPKKPIQDYLPVGTKIPRFQDQPILLEHLATQSSALPRMPGNFAPADFMNPFADYSVEMMMQFLADYSLTRAPGTKYDYSNLGFGLLGRVLSVIGKKEYASLIDERILIPMGMKDTMITVPAEKKARLASPHGFGGQPVSYWQIPAMPGAGALHSSVSDLLTFLSFNMGLKTAAIPSLTKAITTIQQPYLALSEGSPHQIARGWHLLNINGQEYYIHDGGTGGFRSVIGFRRDKSWGVVVLVNSAIDCTELALSLNEPVVN